jgi:hypothetical protein
MKQLQFNIQLHNNRFHSLLQVLCFIPVDKTASADPQENKRALAVCSLILPENKRIRHIHDTNMPEKEDRI